ncbi:Beta-agarase [Catenovulum agarivorans DS-2]|uniref:Beta-agarase n=1 Tax=Catenovulum agarivorans DS-2 TaxID=1328313 RepID=W7QJ64_9ALTE|nr:carbohydrate binding domain-containing protein [Catenovulum agarivorans]EWH08972.1 Beta-agarase [Catenovulum agarivorans DS-2]
MKFVAGVFKQKLLSLAISASFIGFSQYALASTDVKINLTKQKFIGDVSELDRQKFFNLHASPTASEFSEQDILFFKNELNAGFGRAFWGPLSTAKTSDYPTTEQAIANGATSITNAKNNPLAHHHDQRIIMTEHPYNVIVDGNDPVAGARWAADYFQHYYTDETRPLFYEPMNEPFVHSKDFVGTWDEAPNAEMRRHMATWFAEIGKAFDQRGLETQVVGYSAAWPSLELWDFAHWNSRQKMFMDVAGEYMDAFSFHLYDGVNVTGQSNERSGSNAEAIIDLIETYSYIKWGEVKPHAITEYGGIIDGYGVEYSAEKSSQELRSYNHLLFSFLEKEDRLLTSIPFITGIAKWYYQANNFHPYSATVLRPDPAKIVNGKVLDYLPTEKAKFFHLWADVKGHRIDVAEQDPDLAVQAFVYGNKLFVALNNYDNANKAVNLDFVEYAQTPSQVRIKRLNVPFAEAAQYSDETSSDIFTAIELAAHETVVLEYSYQTDIMHTAQVHQASYYANEYMQEIVANQPLTFNFSQVDVQQDNLSFADALADHVTFDKEMPVKKSLSRSQKFMIKRFERLFNIVKRRYAGNYQNSFLFKVLVKFFNEKAYLNQALQNYYAVNGYNDATGQATLRMSIGRKHDKSKQPVVKVNGHLVDVPNNWKGYDQAARDDFFGTIEIPVAAKYLKVHNQVDVTFSDSEGHVSSIVLVNQTEEVFEHVPATDVSIEALANSSINKDKPVRLHANVLPANASYKNVLWSSSDPSIATVNEHGVVTPINPGFVAITATTANGVASSSLDLQVLDRETLRNTVAITDSLQDLAVNDSYSFNVQYSTDTDRDIAVEISTASGQWIATAKTTVAAGEGVATVVVNLPDELEAGATYQVLASLRAVGGNWQTGVDGHRITDMTIEQPEVIVDENNLLGEFNPQFETGSMFPWEHAWDAVGNAYTDANAAKDGDYGLVVDTTAGKVGVTIAPSLFADGHFVAGKEYKLSFDLKRIQGSGWGGGFSQYINTADGWKATPQAWFGLTNQNAWTSIEQTVVIPEWQETATTIQLNFQTLGQVWHVDNIKIEDITPDPNVLSTVNANFESGEIAPWVPYWENNATTVLTVSNAAAKDGQFGLNIQADGNKNTGVTLAPDVFPQDLGLNQGKQYKISFEGRSNTGGKAQGWIRAVAQGGWSSRIETWFELGTEWTHVEIIRSDVDWTVLANPARLDLYLLNNAGLGIDVDIDNVHIEEIE